MIRTTARSAIAFTDRPHLPETEIIQVHIESKQPRVIRPRHITPRRSRNIQQIERRISGIKPPNHRITHGSGGRIAELTAARRFLDHRGPQLRIRTRPGTNGEPRPLRTEPRRQLPGKMHRLSASHLINLRRNQNHHIIQRHIRVVPSQRHHVMRALHNPYRRLTRPIHRPSPLKRRTQIRLRPPRYTNTPLRPLRRSHIRRRDNARRRAAPRSRSISRRTTLLISDLTKPLPSPRRALSKPLPQLLTVVWHARVPTTTRLHQRRLPLLRPLLLVCPQSPRSLITLAVDFLKPIPPPFLTLAELLPQRFAGVRLTGITSTTRLYPPPLALALALLRTRGSSTTLAPDLMKQGIAPCLAPAELLPQRFSVMGLAGVAGTTRLRPRLLPQPLQLLVAHGRSGNPALILDFRKPIPTPRLALAELLPQRVTCVRLTRITSTARLRPRLRPYLRPLRPLLQRPPRPTIHAPDFIKPPPRPLLALSELLAQRFGGIRLTRVAGTTRLHPPFLPLLLLLPVPQSQPGRTTLLPDFRKPPPSPGRTPPVLLPQRHGGVGLTRIPSTTRLRPHRLFQQRRTIRPPARRYRVRCRIRLRVTELHRQTCRTFSDRIPSAGARVGRIRTRIHHSLVIRIQLPSARPHIQSARTRHVIDRLRRRQAPISRGVAPHFR